MEARKSLIGREHEIAELERCYASDKSEFVVVYGRRRVGKTFLVDQLLGEKFTFRYTGGHALTQAEQLARFAKALSHYSGARYAPALRDWFGAFDCLQELLEARPAEERRVVFIDEMPWMDTHRSDFVKAFEHFWNSWAVPRGDVMLVASGSSTSWMADRLFAHQGGLHNRITRRIYLKPFTLYETELFLAAKGARWDRFQTVQCYMALGGVPYYLELLDPTKSLGQNLDALFFAPSGMLRDEFDELYTSLFAQADNYISVVQALAAKREGMTRQEVVAQTGIQGSSLTKVLTNLERCDFIMGYSPFGKLARGTVYRLADFYTLFYLRFVRGHRGKDEHFWTHSLNTPTVNAWQGYTFELVCLSHLTQVKAALGIAGMLTEASTWRGGEERKTQIDLLIDRADRMVNVCEMKFAVGPYAIDSAYAMRLRERLAIFQQATKTRKGLALTFITTYGVVQNAHAGLVASQVTMDDLFEPERR